MKTKLPLQITTVEQAKQFLTDLHNNGEAFHPEDDAIELSGQLFNQDEGNRLNGLMADIYNLDGNNGNHRNPKFDPCEFLNNLDRIAGMIAVISKAESFIAGFEDDDTQDGVDDLLVELRFYLP